MNETKTIYPKLLEIQKKVGAIARDSTNPYFNSKYFDINKLLDTVKPLLSEYGLVLLQPLGLNGTETILTTTLVDAETGEKVETSIPLPTNPDPQKMGSIITYFRRYALQSLLALQGTDDDAEGAYGARTNGKPQEAIIEPQRKSESRATLETTKPQPKPTVALPAPVQEFHSYRIEDLSKTVCTIMAKKNDWTITSKATGFIFTIKKKAFVDQILKCREAKVGICLKVDPAVKDKKLVVDIEPI